MFYILHTTKNQHPLVWWRPKRTGYTEDLDEAGRYPRAEAAKLHMPSAGVYAVPCAEVDARAKRMVADWYRDDMVAFGKRAFPDAGLSGCTHAHRGARVADRKPKFGDWFRNPHASDDNPTRDGMYVRTVRRTGRMNRGTWHELTDGTGKFWQVRPDALQPLTSSPWRPIEERGELEEGAVYLVRCHQPGDGLTSLACSGPELARVIRGSLVLTDPSTFGSEDITHVHRMGPIRGPGETDGNV